jgi:hypothetical protein
MWTHDDRASQICPIRKLASWAQHRMSGRLPMKLPHWEPFSSEIDPWRRGAGALARCRQGGNAPDHRRVTAVTLRSRHEIDPKHGSHEISLWLRFTPQFPGERVLAHPVCGSRGHGCPDYEAMDTMLDWYKR